jgi:hypothetical protein
MVTDGVAAPVEVAIDRETRRIAKMYGCDRGTGEAVPVAFDLSHLGIEWAFCPECGSEEIRYEEGRHKQCANCGQEWFSDLDYRDVVAKNLRFGAAIAASRISTLERELEEARGNCVRLLTAAQEDFVLMKETAATVMSLTQRERAASAALTAAEAKVARMGEALKDVHRVLCDTRIAPSHLVGADIEWCIDHCRIGMQEPTP